MKNFISQNELISKLNAYNEDDKSVFNIEKINNEQLIDFVYKHINKDDICSILLRGSCATGRQNSKSDIDLLILYEGNDNAIVVHDDDLRYHITLFNKSIKINFEDSSFRFYYGMKVIYDPFGIGKKMIDDIYQQIIFNNSKLIKQDPKYKEYMYKLKSFIDDEDNIIQATYAKAKLLYYYPILLSLYNGYIDIGPKAIIDCLIRDNYELSLIYAKALLKSSSVQDIEYLLDNSFNSLCNINTLDTNFDNSKKSFEIYIDNISVYDLFSNYKKFFKYINYLKDNNQTGMKFILECKEKTPELFNKLWSLIN